MKKLPKIFFVVILLLALLPAAERESVDPTNYALGARSIGMGATVVAAGDDANALQANPAALASINKFQIGLSSYQLLDEYNFFNLVSVVPSPWGYFGVSFLSYGITGIPETEIYAQEGSDIRIRESGTYDYGEKVLGLSYALRGPEEFSIFKNVALGVTGKLAQSTLAEQSLTGFGLDAGVRFDIALPAMPYIGELGDFSFGVAMQNILPPTFTEPSDPDSDEDPASSSSYGMNMRLGVVKQFSLFDQQFIAAGDMDNNGTHVGLEYIADRSLRFRAGLDDFNTTLGLGYRLFSMRGFDGNPYTMSLDYAYRVFPEPFNNVHYVSLTILGVSKTKTPVIVTSFASDRLTANAVLLSGTAEPNANISLFVNQRLRKTSKTDASGIWNAENIFLDDGKNEMYAVAQYENFVESDESNVLIVYTDQTKPELKTEVSRDGDDLLIKASLNKEVSAVVSRLPDDSRIVLRRETPLEWQGRWTIAPEYSNTYINLRTMAMDDFGNRSEIVEDVFSTRFINSPRDRTIVSDSTLYVRGTAKRGTVRVTSGGQSVEPDAQGRFVLPVEITQQGKNVVEIAMVDAEERSVTTALRILKVTDADDLQGYTWAKNQITAMLTLGIMENDRTSPTNFRPADYITRKEFAKALAVVKDLTVAARPAAVAVDVPADDEYAPYIRAVLDAGYMSADVDGFRPNAYMVRRDAIVSIVTMDNLDIGRAGARQFYQDVPAYMPYAPQVAAAVNAGIIAPAENFYPDRELTRADAAAMLAASLQAKEKTNELYDWKRGYGVQFEETALSALPPAERAMLADIYVNGRLISFEENAAENLRVIAPQDRDIIDRPQVDVKGLVRNDMQVTINGVIVPAQSGAFLARVNLNEGRNIIRVEGGGESRVLRVLFVQGFSDKADTLDNLKYNVSRRYLDSGNFDGVQTITRGEIMRIIYGIKGQTGDTTSTASVSFAEAAALLNEWDGKPANSTAVQEGLTDPGRALTRDEFINMLANTDIYRDLISSYGDFDAYERDSAPEPQSIEDKSEIIIQAEQLSAGSDKKKIASTDFQSFLARYDQQRLNNANAITRTGDSIAADGRTRLSVVYPPNNFRTNEASVTLRGFSGGLENVRVNGRQVRAASDSSFEAALTLEAGRNVITVDNGMNNVRLAGLRYLTYSDIQNIPERSLIENLATIGYFKEGAEFFPNKDMTREEAAALFVRMINATPPQVYQEVYRDVPANRWSAPSIRLLVDRGVIKDANTFRPEESITQQEAYDWFRQLSRAELSITPRSTLPRRSFVRWLFADERVRSEIDRLNQ